MAGTWLENASQDNNAGGAARWELFDHEADIGVRGFGSSMAQSFEQAGLALTAVVTAPETVAPVESLTIECKAPDCELLFYEWLNALVYEMATRGMLFANYSVIIDGNQLVARVAGELVDVRRHKPAVEVKGATLTELQVGEGPDGIWMACCVVDV